MLAEAEIPRAIAEAFRSGNLGVIDYYKLKNVQADTSMREASPGRRTGIRRDLGPGRNGPGIGHGEPR